MEKVVVAAARLSASAAVALAAGLAATVPVTPGSGVPTLIGWLATAVLAGSLAAGYRGGVVIVAVLMVVRLALMSPLGFDVVPPVWVQALLLVLIVEAASASLSLRSRVSDLASLIGRGLAAAVGGMALTAALTILVDNTTASGILVRAVGLAAAVLAGGWVVWMWRQAMAES